MGNSIGDLWKQLACHFPRGKFFHNLSVVMTGTVIAQLFGLALMPLVSRLFSPADFGIFGTFYSLVGVWGAFITFSFNQTIILPKLKKEAWDLFIVACLSVAFVAVSTAIVMVLFPSGAAYLLKAPNRWFLPLFLVAIVALGLNLCLEAWCTRTSAFKSLAISQVVRMVTAVGLWIALGWGNLGAIGLVFGLVCGDIVAGLNLGQVLKKDLKEGWTFPYWSRVKQLVGEYRDFLFYASPQGLISALSQGLPVLLLGHFFGIGVAGAYAFSVKILQTPMTYISAPLWRVVLQRSSEIHHQDEDLFPFYIKGTLVLLAVILLPTVIFFIWAPQIFSWLFGVEWREAGVYARWLVLWLSIVFINAPASSCATILRQQPGLFIYQSIILVSRAAVLVLGGIYLTPLATIIMFSVMGFVLSAGFVIWAGALLYKKRQDRLNYAV